MKNTLHFFLADVRGPLKLICYSVDACQIRRMPKLTFCMTCRHPQKTYIKLNKTTEKKTSQTLNTGSFIRPKNTHYVFCAIAY